MLQNELYKSKVAIYIRVSTNYQVDKDSLQVQKRELIAYSDMLLGIKEYEVFEDPGYSAKNTDRPDYQRMMDRLRTGEFTHLLVWKIDRISRNLLDFASMYKELKELGITFVSKNEQFDTSSAIGEAMLKIILVFAELERNMTSERVTAVMLSRANNGQWNGGKIPFGYDYDKKTKSFTLNKSESEIVRKIYNDYDQYHSIKHICNTLNSNGIHSRNDNEWSTTTVHKILTNPFYIGLYRYNVHSDGKGHKKRDKSEWIEIENHHKGIINVAQFDRTQYNLKRNIRGYCSRGETHLKQNIHIFSGLLKCGVCGSNMSASPDRIRADGIRPSMYGCMTRRKNSNACNNKYVNDIAVGPFIFNLIANIIKAKSKIKSTTTTSDIQKMLLKGKPFAEVTAVDNESLNNLLSALKSQTTVLEYKPTFNSNNSSDFEELHFLQKNLKRKENALNRLHSLYLYSDSGIPEKDYIVERQNLLSEISDLKSKIEALESSRTSLNISNDDTLQKASYLILIDKLISSKELDYTKYVKSIDASVSKNFLNAIIEEITISDSKVTSITFKSGIDLRFHY